MDDKCVFCDKPLDSEEPTCRLGQKGCDGIAKASDLRNSSIITVPGQVVHVNCRKDFCSSTSISKDSKHQIKNESGPSTCAAKRRSLSSPFKYGENCLYCGKSDEYSGKKRTHVLVPIRTTESKIALLKICDERNDTWASTVRGRVSYVNDLHSADAVYHLQCCINFRTGRQIPKEFDDETSGSKRAKQGRPADLTRAVAFLRVADYLQANDDEQISIQDLIKKMEEFLVDTDGEPYGFTFMKSKLKEHFGDDIIIAEVNGKANVVTFWQRASKILHDFYNQDKEANTTADKMRLIETAAKLIKSDVRSMEQSKETYPNVNMVSSEEATAFLPDSLKLLLDKLIVGKDVDQKISSLGQAIMQAIRPRLLIAPLQIGLGVQMHHHFGSRFLIDSLHAHGFCSSYYEVQKFERSAAVAKGTDIQLDQPENHVIQYVADNADHNKRTLDGLNTFHGMGIIATVTPKVRSVSKVPRVSATLEDVKAVGRINIQHLLTPCNGLASMKYGKLEDKKVQDETSHYDLLWKVSLTVRSPRPAWSGTMQAVMKGQHPGKSSVIFLPMIDMNPNDMSCIYSTLAFICSHAKRYNATPIITFDQPLWWKALIIIESEPEGSELRSIVLRLGGFHTLMSFLGTIGYIMAGSGLKSLLELVYAENAVTHMMSGKAYDRAVRGHLLVDACLNTILAAEIFGTQTKVDIETNAKDAQGDDINSGQIGDDMNEEMADGDVQQSDNTDEDLLGDADGEKACNSSSKERGETDVVPMTGIASGEHGELMDETDDTDAMTVDDKDDQQSSDTEGEQVDTIETRDPSVIMVPDDVDMGTTIDLDEVRKMVEAMIRGDTIEETAEILKDIHDALQKRKSLMKDQRTAQLWLCYMDMIDIVRKFIKSERIGNWQLHLQALRDILPYLAAAGHNLYTKSISVYLQRLELLPIQHPEVQKHFDNGFHVVRRSDRYWAGLSTDLIIEQVLMRSLKTTGGLTRGRGMDESQRATWILSNPICAEFNDAMQDYTSVSFSTSDQHKDLSSARQVRDAKDTKKIMTYLKSKSPFELSDQSLHSIDTGVTARECVNVDNVVDVGKKILNGMHGQKVLDYVFKKKNQVVTLAANTTVQTGKKTITIDPQLLFQRLVTAGSHHGNLNEAFTYELCSYPPALFSTTDVLLSANKPTLANAMWKQLPDTSKSSQLPPNVEQYVLDGGALLHRVQWDVGETYDHICQRYINYVERKYHPAIVVFDGYESGPSTKDVTHTKRTDKKTSGTVNFTGDMVCPMRKEVFLVNKRNKQRFINLLSQHFQDHGIEVAHAESDADVLIVQTAVASAASTNTVLIGDDTDLLVLLCSQTVEMSYDIYFRPEPKTNAKGPAKCWNIKLVKAALGKDICDNLLFAHALLGCDTTSRLFGSGKPVALKKLKTSVYFRQQASYFKEPQAAHEDIVTAGEKALVCVLGGKANETLDTLRFNRFHQKVASSTTSIQPCNLPPTSAAAKYHSQRVYLQVQQWSGVNICPEEWGWKMVNGKLVPIQTDMKPAPDYLLEVICCGCKTGCARNCGCRKYGLQCSPACSECKGLHCTNVILTDSESDSDDV